MHSYPASGLTSAIEHPRMTSASRRLGSSASIFCKQRRAFRNAAVAQLHFGQQPQQLRIVARDFRREQRAGARHIAARHEPLDQLHANRGVGRVGVSRARQHVEAFVFTPQAKQLRRKMPQLVGARRELARGVEIAARDVGLHEHLAQRHVLGIDLRRLGEQLQRVGVFAFFLKVGGVLLRADRRPPSDRPSSTRARTPANRVSRSAPSRSPRRMRTSATPFASPRARRRSARSAKFERASTSSPWRAEMLPRCHIARSSSGLIFRIFL